MPDRGTFTVHEMVRRARRQMGLSQAEIALETGCRQSAISMFEAGRSDALSSDRVARLAQKLGIDVAALPDADSRSGSKTRVTLKYCPVDECPSNVPYVVRGQLHLRPTMVERPLAVHDRCAFCGEVLEDRCPNHDCGADLADGSFCRKCGTPYVTTIEREDVPLLDWADTQRSRIRELRALTERQPHRL